jgi:hypothetical protein
MTSEYSWESVKNSLRNNLNLDERRIILLGEIRAELRSLASTGISTMPDFTLHNETHSDDIILLIGNISKYINPKLSEYESYLLAVSAYLHDIGMFFSAGRLTSTILPDLSKTLKVCSNDICDGGVRYQKELVDKTIDLQIRVIHHLLSARMIDSDGVAQFHLSNYDLPHIIAICRGHRKADLSNGICDCYETKPSKFGDVRRGLLASLLRLTDALDFFPERAPLIDLRERAWDFLLNPVSLNHWLHHFFVNSVKFTINTISCNKILECDISYVFPLNGLLNGRSYEYFFQPMLEKFLAEIRLGDFDKSKYPLQLFTSLDINDIQIKFAISSQLGAITLPQIIIEKINQCKCDNANDFIRYLDKEISQEKQNVDIAMDRRPEVQTFRTMLEGDDIEHRLILLVGEHGQGKTWLMRYFEKMCDRRQTPCYKVDLSGNTKIEDILTGIWQRLGPGNFPHYSAIRESIELSSHYSSSERQRDLSESFFLDWQSIESSIFIVLLFDTFEKAPPSIKVWFDNQFLNGVSKIYHTIVVIGGRESIVTNDYWTNHSYLFPLTGVQLKDYREYAKQRGIPISEADLIQLHKKWNGLPKLFDEYLNNLVIGL